MSEIFQTGKELSSGKELIAAEPIFGQGDYKTLINQIMVLSSVVNRHNFKTDADGLSDEDRTALNHLRIYLERLHLAISHFWMHEWNNVEISASRIAEYDQEFLINSKELVSETFCTGPALCQQIVDLLTSRTNFAAKVDGFIKKVAHDKREFPAEDFFPAPRPHERELYIQMFRQLGGVQGAIQLAEITKQVFETLMAPAKPAGYLQQLLDAGSKGAKALGSWVGISNNGFEIRSCPRLAADLPKKPNLTLWTDELRKGIPEKGSGFQLGRGDSKTDRPDRHA